VPVRYADDLLAFCRTHQHAEQVKQQLAEWLRPRGLGFNAAKTQIVHLNQGCDFLGFNIRRYHGKLPLIKPSDHAVRRIRERLRTEMRVLLGSNAASVLHTLTPIVRGWAAYYRIGSPARCSPRWITTCGSCSTNGSSEHPRTSPGGGAWSGTSTGSTAPATTGGSSVTKTPEPTCPSSPGRRSSGT
jgi:hypothetical protein